MREEEYINKLENLLIFLCSTYEACENMMFDKNINTRNDILMNFPKIQGTINTIAIHKLSELEKTLKDRASYLPEIAKEIQQRRSQEPI